MSVILYDNEKFFKIYASLKPHGRDMAHLWYYPEGWDKYTSGHDGMNNHLADFVNLLAQMNTEAWNERYNEAEHRALFEKIPAAVPYSNIYELIKSLKSIYYNSEESVSFEETKAHLFEVIYFLMSEAIGTIPAYEIAETWKI